MQGIFTPGPDVLIHLAALAIPSIVSIAAGYFAMKLRNAMLELKSELVGSQNAMRADMDQKHAENKQTVAVHIGEDNAKFEALGITMGRIDNTLIRLEERTRFN